MKMYSRGKNLTDFQKDWKTAETASKNKVDPPKDALGSGAKGNPAVEAGIDLFAKLAEEGLQR